MPSWLKATLAIIGTIAGLIVFFALLRPTLNGIAWLTGYATAQVQTQPYQPYNVPYGGPINGLPAPRVAQPSHLPPAPRGMKWATTGNYQIGNGQRPCTVDGHQTVCGW